MKNSIASVFAVFYVTTFDLPYYNIVLAIIFKARAIFLTKNFKAINFGISTNKKAIIEEQNFETKSKTLLIYIRKRISLVENLYGISVSISLFLFLCLSLII